MNQNARIMRFEWIQIENSITISIELTYKLDNFKYKDSNIPIANFLFN